MALLTTRRIWPVLLVSGAFGCLCGALLQPTWQIVIEPSQILAGAVAYDHDSPAALFATRAWTILHQLTALAIAIGVPERTLTVAWSGLVGLLSFQALALTALAMGATRTVASLTPLLVYVSGATRFVPGYPVDLLGWPHTWGMVAQGLLLLLLALLALQRYRAAALVLGVFPAVHIGAGLWAWIIAGVVAVPLHRTWTGEARSIARWCLAGLGITLVSAVVQLVWFSTPAPPVIAGMAELMRGIRLHWDTHRLPLAAADVSVLVSVALAAACLVWHRSFGRHLPPATWWLTAGFAAAVTLALAADLAIRVLPEDAGVWVARPMPRRLLSIPLLGGMAWIIGLSTGPWAPAAVRTVSALLLAAMAVMFLRPVGDFPVPSQFVRRLTDAVIGDWLQVALLLVGAAGIVLTLGGRLPATWQRWCEGRPDRFGQRALHGALLLLAAFVIAEAWHDGRANIGGIEDRTNNTLLATVAARPGVLLTAGGTTLVQAATRRRVLLDLSLTDVLVYTPVAAAIAEHIAQRVYGLSLSEPPPRADGPSGASSGLFGEAVWTARTEGEWRAIGAEFGVTDVLTPAEWSLQLPLVIRDDRYALWTMPRPPLVPSR